MDKSSNVSISELCDLDKKLINVLQKGLPICESPFEEIAAQLDSTEEEIMQHVQALLDNRTLSRFGPMFDAACLGGAFTLAALSVPEERFEKVTEQVNSFEQIAHNYRRAHYYNMWFVIATESAEEIEQIINEIENITGLPVLNTPKLEEFYVGLYLPV